MCMGPDDDVREEWFGPLIDAEPEELAESLFKSADAQDAAPTDN